MNNNTLDIYRGGVILATIDIDEGTVFNEKLQGEKTITCPIEGRVALPVQPQDYIIYEEEVFEINKVPDFDKDSESLSKVYEFLFEAIFYRLLNWFIEHQGVKKFSLFATAKDHVLMIMASANMKGSGWVVSEVDDTEEFNIDYDFTYIRTALDDIANKGSLEWQFKGKTLRMVKSIGRETGLSFSMGRGKGLHQIKRSADTSKSSVNRVFGVGGSRNIDSTYRGGLQKNLIFDGEYVQTPEVTAWLNGTGPEVLIKEGKYVNEDIYPQFTGTVSATTISKNTAGDIVSARITCLTIDFDINAQMQPDTKAHVSFLTGDMIGTEFEISSYNSATKTITIIPNKDTDGYTLPNEVRFPVVGNTFTLLDMRMPVTYVVDGEGKLKTETQTYLDDNKFNRIIYGVIPDEKHLRSNQIKLQVGDRGIVEDAEMEINDTLRFVGISFPIVNRYKVTGVIGNQIIYDRVIKLFADVNAVHQQIADIDRRGQEIAKRGAQNLRVLADSVFDIEGNFDSSKFNVGVLMAMLGIFGIQSANFLLNKVFITANFMGDPDAVNISAGELFHLEYSNPGNQNIWQMQPITQIGLMPNNKYYVYSKLSKTSQVGSFLITTDQIRPDDLPGFYTIRTGLIYPQIDGLRDVDFTYGITTVNGRQIKAGIIQGNTGALIINLDTGEIFGKMTFRASNGAIKDVVTVDNTAALAQANALAAQILADGANSAAQLAVAKNYSAGKMLYTDPEFSGSYGANGYNGINLYNNAGGGALTIIRGTSYSDFTLSGLPANPNSTGCYLSLYYNAGGVVSPGFGGFFFGTQTRANAIFITRIVAMIPVGRTINWASNAIGTGGIAGEWLTSQQGTGKWQEYICKVTCGGAGTFSSTNFFYIDGGADTGFSWFLSFATVYDMTGAASDPLKYADTQMQAAITQANATAATIAQSKVDVAKAITLSQASTDAQAKADAAYNNSLAASNAYSNNIGSAAAADASNKATAAYNNAQAAADAKYNALTGQLGNMAFRSVQTAAGYGITTIDNGSVITFLVDAAYIRSNVIDVGYITGLNLNFVQGSIGGIVINQNGILASNGTFYINNQGQLYCTQATVSGTINATSGVIGGFNISSSQISSGGFLLDPVNRMMSFIDTSNGMVASVVGSLNADLIGYGVSPGVFVNERNQLVSKNTALTISAKNGGNGNYAIDIINGDILVHGKKGYTGYNQAPGNNLFDKYEAGIYLGRGTGAW